MRARLAIIKSKEAVELRDVKLTNKPLAMLNASPKGTVPILVVAPSHIIDESLDVMLWSLGKNDPDNLLLGHCKPHCSVKQSGNVIQSKSKSKSTIDTKQTYNCADLIAFIDVYDRQFKPCLERYKAAKRYHETNINEFREACEKFIEDLDKRLSEHDYIFGECESLADIAILPFIRQFAKVERQWYVQSSYSSLKIWLDRYLQSAMFNKIMAQHPIWEEGSEVIVFCGG
jgi:glutathione S-transferase